MNNKKSTVAKSFKELNEYNKKWGWLRKSEYVIEKKGIPLTTKEIIKELADIHEQDIDLKLAGNRLPATLSVGAKEGKINRTKNEKGDYVYSLIK